MSSSPELLSSPPVRSVSLSTCRPLPLPWSDVAIPVSPQITDDNVDPDLCPDHIFSSEHGSCLVYDDSTDHDPLTVDTYSVVQGPNTLEYDDQGYEDSHQFDYRLQRAHLESGTFTPFNLGQSLSGTSPPASVSVLEDFDPFNFSETGSIFSATNDLDLGVAPENYFLPSFFDFTSDPDHGVDLAGTSLNDQVGGHFEMKIDEKEYETTSITRMKDIDMDLGLGSGSGVDQTPAMSRKRAVRGPNGAISRMTLTASPISPLVESSRRSAGGTWYFSRV